MPNKYISWVFKQSLKKKNNGQVEHFTFLKTFANNILILSLE